MPSQNILFVASEVAPLIKTGGLADVAGSLPAALKTLKQDIRVVMPAYRAALPKALPLSIVSLNIAGVPEGTRLLEGRLPGTSVKLYLIDIPELFDREGGPYVDTAGHDWSDNAERFAAFSRAACALALDQAGLNWRADIVHCNDWQSGLVPALLSRHAQRPATVFTIHNLAYQGHFGSSMLHQLGLPTELWHMHGLEFHGGLSYMKGALSYADAISTVSPTYAEEIQTAAYGYGFEGLLGHRRERLRGILNGVDYKQWSPDKDAHLSAPYSVKDLSGKAINKTALQQHFKLTQDADTPLIGLVGRLAEQKGIDLLLANIELIKSLGAQLVVLGTGDKYSQTALTQAAAAAPGQIGVHIGFDEGMAHRIEAGSDMFLMPSRFEPCGLNQIYSLKYGTVPIVRHTGGLADTVVDASPENLAAKSATGFVFSQADSDELAEAIRRAVGMYRDHNKLWQQIVNTGMKQDFGWRYSAKQYLELYQSALNWRDAN